MKLFQKAFKEVMLSPTVFVSFIASINLMMLAKAFAPILMAPAIFCLTFAVIAFIYKTAMTLSKAPSLLEEDKKNKEERELLNFLISLKNKVVRTDYIEDDQLLNQLCKMYDSYIEDHKSGIIKTDGRIHDDIKSFFREILKKIDHQVSIHLESKRTNSKFKDDLLKKRDDSIREIRDCIDVMQEAIENSRFSSVKKDDANLQHLKDNLSRRVRVMRSSEDKINQILSSGNDRDYDIDYE